MSKISNLIKELQLKQKKIDYISYIADLLKNDKHCVDYKDVQEEVLSQIEPILLKLIESIENDSPLKTESKPEPQLSEDEMKVIKMLAQKALQKSEAPRSSQAAPKETTSQKKESALSNHDKLTFGLNHRHFANKRVLVENDWAIKIEGQCVGLDAPFVIVKTDNGPTISVPPEKVSIVL